MIDATARIPLDADLDAVLAIADADRLALCESCVTFVPYDEAAVVRGWCLCGACQRAQAEIDADLDLLHPAAQTCPVDLYDDVVPF